MFWLRVVDKTGYLSQARSQTMPIEGAIKILGGNGYWSLYSTNHHNHWQRHYYENGGTKQCCERSEKKNFGVCIPNCDILGVH